MYLNTFLVSFLLIMTNYLFIIYAFKKYGQIGLFICIPITIILANLQVVITITFLSFSLTLGNIAYASSYLITDLLGELYSKKAAKKAVGIGFLTLVMMTVIMNIVLLYQPEANSREMYDSVANIFHLMPRIAAASFIAYFCSQNLDVVVFHKLKLKSRGGLWLRNNISTISSQLIDGLIFTTVAFYGIYSNSELLEIFISTYIIKTVIAMCDTPFMYLGVYLKKSQKVKEINEIQQNKRKIST